MSLLAEFTALRPAGGFGLIMADPPWAYEMRSENGYAKSPQAQYACMPIAEIRAMPVEALAAPDCLLWLWSLKTMLPEALSVIEAWGFAFKTSGHWAKMTRHGKQHFGQGYLLRDAGDPFLIATRGAPKTTKSVRSVVFGQVREHSRKPEEGYREAERLMPEARRLDLFSRQRREGWSSWGNETDRFEAAS